MFLCISEKSHWPAIHVFTSCVMLVHFFAQVTSSYIELQGFFTFFICVCSSFISFENLCYILCQFLCQLLPYFISFLYCSLILLWKLCRNELSNH